MKKTYVSDMLEVLIDGEDARNIVRAQCERILAGASPSAQATLSKPLHYIAGKCMGYPAAWLVKHACNLDNRDLAARLAATPGPVYVSLTTSIADDFLDREQNVGASQMMLLYLFMFEALRNAHWFNDGIERQYSRSVYPVIDFFLHDQSDRKAMTVNQFAAAGQNPGRRIGAFFETIARGLIPQETERSEAVVKIAGMFGDWCSLLDDILDTENDIDDGIFLSYPIYQIMHKSEALAGAVMQKNAAACLAYTRTDEFLNLNLDQAARELSDIRSLSETEGFDGLATALEAVADRLPRILTQHRNVSLDLYASRNIAAQRRTA